MSQGGRQNIHVRRIVANDDEEAMLLNITIPQSDHDSKNEEDEEDDDDDDDCSSRNNDCDSDNGSISISNHSIGSSSSMSNNDYEKQSDSSDSDSSDSACSSKEEGMFWEMGSSVMAMASASASAPSFHVSLFDRLAMTTAMRRRNNSSAAIHNRYQQQRNNRGLDSTVVTTNSSSNQCSESKGSKERYRKRRRSSGLLLQLYAFNQWCFPPQRRGRRQCGGGQRINALLCLSFFAWLYLKFGTTSSINNNSHNNHESDQVHQRQRQSNAQTLMEKIFHQRQNDKRISLTTGEMAQLRKQRQKEAHAALGSAAGGGLLGGAGAASIYSSMFGGKQQHNKKKGHHAEDLPPGCDYTEWQKRSFPNCNELHELDLREAIHWRTKKHHSSTTTTSSSSSSSIGDDNDGVGYVGSGLWRHVWTVDPHGEMMVTNKSSKHQQHHHQQQQYVPLPPPTVLKMIKAEHDVDKRNMDRHRRDAVVMERLHSSPYIVSMYAYCGNTVLTEYVASDLNAIVGHDAKHSIPLITRETPEGRLRIALGIMRGIQAMHEAGPIVHADIGWKQFLVSDDGTIKLNDFNRCRFIPTRRNGTTTTNGNDCNLQIPSAPGTGRSPEEYEYKALTEKLDVYSAANVLFEILTGTEPWEHLKGSQAKDKIRRGERPPIPNKYLTTDAALAALIDLAFEYDPVHRISASELVSELESLLRSSSR